jgi:hypothetical protein
MSLCDLGNKKINDKEFSPEMAVSKQAEKKSTKDEMRLRAVRVSGSS